MASQSVMLHTAAACPACGGHVSVPFFDGGMQPLATIAWPESSEAAQHMKRLPNDFVRCVECGHIFNRSFRYADVPYTDKPNLMFNKGTHWAEFIRTIQGELITSLAKQNPCVVEIGHGDGGFLSALCEHAPQGRYIGFDPHGATGSHASVQFRQSLFMPVQHLPELSPDLLVMRHVLEHFESAIGFLQQLAFAAHYHATPLLGYFEVPCVDRVMETGRTADFYYEHNSQFTTHSFRTMLARAGFDIRTSGHGYDGEVVYAIAALVPDAAQSRFAREAAAFHTATQHSLATITAQLAALLAEGKKIAIWGGTGKSAAFMHRYGGDAKRFPTVVDSDPAKAGTFVPGCGQEIRMSDWLLAHPHEVIIIPPQWRAADIVAEIRRKNIHFTSVLIEHDGRLVDFLTGNHPYRREE